MSYLCWNSYTVCDNFSQLLNDNALEYAEIMGITNRSIEELNENWFDPEFVKFTEIYKEGLKSFPLLGQTMFDLAAYLDEVSNIIRELKNLDFKNVNNETFPNIQFHSPDNIANDDESRYDDADSLLDNALKLETFIEKLRDVYEKIDSEMRKVEEDWKDQKYEEFKESFYNCFKVLEPIIEATTECIKYERKQVAILKKY